jgi:hypothetical protein
MSKVKEQRKRCDELYKQCSFNLDDENAYNKWRYELAKLDRYEHEAGMKVTYPKWIVNKYSKLGDKANMFQIQSQPDMVDVTIHMWRLLSIKIMCIVYEYVSGVRFKKGFKSNCLEVLYEQYNETKEK